jgi:hypothetical protein
VARINWPTRKASNTCAAQLVWCIKAFTITFVSSTAVRGMFYSHLCKRFLDDLLCFLQTHFGGVSTRFVDYFCKSGSPPCVEEII